MKKVVILYFLFIPFFAFSQLSLDTEQTVEWYVENVLVGAGVTVSNITYKGDYRQFAAFADGEKTNLGIDEGLFMSTGKVKDVKGPNDSKGGISDELNEKLCSDPDLKQINNKEFYDIAIIEFDFVPQGKDLRFEYVFGSEEYPEFVFEDYNDIFAFLISGPGIDGPFTNKAENIAVVPGTNLPVSIDNINPSNSGRKGNKGPTNAEYYVDNFEGETIQYDGFTTLLTAKATVQPCETYHIKLIIADLGDGIYDSGVFLRGGSFSSTGIKLSPDYGQDAIGDFTVEGCVNGDIILRVNRDVQNDSVVDFTIGGTAINGVDYELIQPQVTIPAGTRKGRVPIVPLKDNVIEGTETVVLTFVTSNVCTGAATADVTVLIDDDFKITPVPYAVTCGVPTVTPNILGTGNFQWYATADDKEPIATSVNNGATTPFAISDMKEFIGVPGDRTFTVYVEDLKDVQKTIHSVAHEYQGYTTELQPHDTVSFYFDALSDFTLDGFILGYNNMYENGKLLVNIRNSQGNLIASRNTQLPNSGWSEEEYEVKDLNLEIPKGTGYRIDFLGSRTSISWITKGGGDVFPVTYGTGGTDILTIKKHGGSKKTGSPHFFDWVIKAKGTIGGTCGRMPFEITEFCPCVMPEDVVVSSAVNLELCPGDDVLITSNKQKNTTDFTFEWRKDSPIGTIVKGPTVGVNTLDLNVDYTDAGTYYMVVYDSKDQTCSKSASIEVKAKPAPTTPVPTAPAVCEGEVLKLNAGASGNDSYVWTGPASYSSSEENPERDNSLVTYSGDYSVYAVLDGCKSEIVNVKAIVNALPTVDLGPDKDECERATLDAGFGYDSYLWSTGETTRSIEVVNTGIYSVTVTTDNCSSTDEVAITIHPLPVIDLGADIVACSQATIDAGSGYDNYLWNTGETTPSIDVTESGEYTLEVSKNNCTSYDAIQVTVNPRLTPSITISSGLTEICEKESLMVSVSDSLNLGANPTYKWLINGVKINETGTEIQIDTLTKDAIITLEATTSETCITQSTAVSSIPIKISNNLIPYVEISSLKDPYCSVDQVELWVSDSTGGGTDPRFEWYINDVMRSETLPRLLLNNVKNGDEVKVMHSNSNCANPKTVDDTYTLQIIEFPGPSISFIEDDTTICANQELTIRIKEVIGEGYAPLYQWIINSQEVSTSSSLIQTDTLTRDAVIELTVTNTDDCVLVPEKKITLDVEVLPNLTPSIELTSLPEKSCPKTPTTFKVENTVNAGNTPNFTWIVNGETLPMNTSYISTDTLSELSTIEVTMTSSEMCLTIPTVSKSLATVRNPQPNIIVQEDICLNDDAIEIQAENKLATGGDFMVTPAIGIKTMGGKPYFSPQEAKEGVHTIAINWIDDNNCKAQTSAIIEVHDIISPTAVTPVIDIIGILPYTNLQAQGSGTINWYNEELQLQSNGSSFNPNQTECDKNECVFTYYVSQTLEPFGCESEKVAVEYILAKCPVPAPIVHDYEACDYETSKRLEVDTASVWVHAEMKGESSIHWYNSALDNVNNNDFGGFDKNETNIKSQTYMVRQYNDFYNCYSPMVTFDLEVKSVERPDVYPNPMMVCEGVLPYSSFHVLSESTATVSWYSTADTTSEVISHLKEYSPQNNINESTDFFVSQTINGCQSPLSSVNFQIIPKPNMPSVPNQDECEDERHLIFTQSPVGTDVLWFSEEGVHLETGDSFVVDESWLDLDKSVCFKAILLSDEGCASDTVSTFYELISRPKMPIIVGEDVICLGSDFDPYVALTGNTLDSVVWRNENDNNLWYGNEFKPSHFVEERLYTFQALAYHKYCEGTPSIKNVRVVSVPSPKIEGSFEFCEFAGQQRFSKVVTDSENDVYWSFSGQSNYYTLQNDEQSMYVDISEQGIDTIFVTETSADKCVGRDSVIIYTASKPIALIQMPFETGFDENEIFNATENTVIVDGNTEIELENTYEWSFSDDLELLDISDESLLVKGEFGSYSVGLFVENEFGCTDSIEEMMFIDVYGSLYVPNAFAPTNAAHRVRKFQPMGTGLQSYEIFIFDGWGNVLWYSNKLSESGNPSEGWDGKANGKGFQAGTYTWKITAVYSDGTPWEGVKKPNGKYSNYGTVLLIR